MENHYVFVSDEADIRQGDVIRRLAETGDEILGFILTADCDIAHNKAGDRFTWLEIVSAKNYIETYWASDQLRRFVEKQCKVACDGLNGLMKRSGIALASITPTSLSEWLAEVSAEDIVSRLSHTNKIPDSKLITNLRAVRVALGYEGPKSALDRLRSVWLALGRDEVKQQAVIREAFSSSGHFPDHVLVPELPNVEGLGFVILLRSISSISSTEVFRSETEAKINGQPFGFYRIGRFTDNVKHSVSQKLAFLFSRIGLSPHFEDACAAATELLIESIL